VVRPYFSPMQVSSHVSEIENDILVIL
jgi:hypothetical protein